MILILSNSFKFFDILTIPNWQIILAKLEFFQKDLIFLKNPNHKSSLKKIQKWRNPRKLIQTTILLGILFNFLIGLVSLLNAPSSLLNYPFAKLIPYLKLVSYTLSSMQSRTESKNSGHPNNNVLDGKFVSHGTLREFSILFDTYCCQFLFKIGRIHVNSTMPNRFADCHRLKKGGKKDYSKDTKAVVEKKKENIDVSFNNYFRLPFLL